jgi:hypothetical protein
MTVRLVNGDELAPEVRREVLSRFVHRHLSRRKWPTDEAWLAGHAFYVTVAGALSRAHKRCEPARCRHAGRFHLAADGLTVVKPHVQASGDGDAFRVHGCNHCSSPLWVGPRLEARNYEALLTGEAGED